MRAQLAAGANMQSHTQALQVQLVVNQEAHATHLNAQEYS